MSPRCGRRPLLALLALVLGGCSALRGIEAPEPAAAVEDARGDPAEAGRVLAYYAKLRQMPAPELAREQEAARRTAVRARTDAARLRSALLLTLPGAAAGDDQRALELLEPVTRSSDSGLRGLALLLTTLLQEQRRLDASAHGLQQKLDALMNLERNMTGRDGARRR